MTLPAISVRGLGKMYRLAHESKRTDSFREAITSTVLAPFRRLRQLRGTDEKMEDFWALKDVSFDVQPGEVVGIIGRNGAGKSTLLKILSRIVEPTAGEIRLRGRVASLLEVGTGFHPELTGRENIYLNGSILGMKKREIDRKFDEIVDFAEVEKFLDTPVKRYSSGMYVRLAFAVAAHLDPEILIVDEVLAVGDFEFQRKCLGKMKEVSCGTGRTVLFVSHNMAMIRALCSQGIFLQNGQINLQGDIAQVADSYGREDEGNNKMERMVINPPASASYWIESIKFLVDGMESTIVPMGAEFTIELGYVSKIQVRNPKILVIITAEDGQKVLQMSNRFSTEAVNEQCLYRGTLSIRLENTPFCTGNYRTTFHVGDIGGVAQVLENVASFHVEARDVSGSGRIPHPGNGPIWLPANFSIRSKSD